jgi:hypothetical protein
MCMVAYIASRSALPLIPLQESAFERHVPPADLVAEDFFLRERELLVTDHDS